MNSTIADLGIGEDALLQAISAAEITQETDEPGWFTVEELTRTGGLGVTTLRKRLKAQVEAGAVECKKVTRTSLLGARYHCMGFKVKAK